MSKSNSTGKEKTVASLQNDLIAELLSHSANNYREGDFNGMQAIARFASSLVAYHDFPPGPFIRHWLSFPFALIPTDSLESVGGRACDDLKNEILRAYLKSGWISHSRRLARTYFDRPLSTEEAMVLAKTSTVQSELSKDQLALIAQVARHDAAGARAVKQLLDERIKYWNNLPDL